MHRSILSVKNSGFLKLLDPKIASVEAFLFDRTIQDYNLAS